MSGIYIAIIALCGGSLLIGLIAQFVRFSNDVIQISRYKAASPKAPEGGVSAVIVSDLHGKRFGKGNGILVNKVKELAPDFICVTGDIIHKYRPRDEEVAAEAVALLSKVAPVYYVSGNHEMRSRKYRAFAKRLEESGATVLDSRGVQAFGLNIVGLNCAHLKSDKMFKLAEGEGFKLLLSHVPHYLDRYAAAGYDLVFSGHAHGGQWRIPFTRIGIYSPGQGLFPKLISGRHICGGTQMIISRGLGNSECKLRLFNRPELVKVDIVRE